MVNGRFPRSKIRFHSDPTRWGRERKMKEQSYDIQSVRRHLLGSLSDAETERYDELSFSDNDFNDIVGSIEHDLVDAYVNGELAGNELERFRAYYLASPRRRMKVDFAKEFRIFAARENAVQSINETEERKRGIFDLFTAPVLQWGFAAATVALAVVSALFWIQNSQLQQQISGVAYNANLSLTKQQELEKQIAGLKESANTSDQQLSETNADRDRLQRELDEARAEARAAVNRPETTPRPSTSGPAPTTVASFVLMPSLRGSGQLQPIQVPKNASRVVMQLRLEPNDFNSYSAVLRDPDTGKTLWRSGRLRTVRQGDSASTSVSIPANLLTSKVYTISLSGLVGSGPPESFSDYTFQVMR